MEPTSKASRILPTLSLILAFLPTVLMAVLIALSARGNWGFIILGGITYFVSQILCGIACIVIGILCIRRKWGRGRAITAIILSAFGLFCVLAVAGSFLINGIL